MAIIKLLPLNASFTFSGTTCDTNATCSHKLLSLSLVETPLSISPIMLSFNSLLRVIQYLDELL